MWLIHSCCFFSSSSFSCSGSCDFSIMSSKYTSIHRLHSLELMLSKNFTFLYNHWIVDKITHREEYLINDLYTFKSEIVNVFWLCDKIEKSRTNFSLINYCRWTQLIQVILFHSITKFVLFCNPLRYHHNTIIEMRWTVPNEHWKVHTCICFMMIYSSTHIESEWSREFYHLKFILSSIGWGKKMRDSLWRWHTKKPSQRSFGWFSNQCWCDVKMINSLIQSTCVWRRDIRDKTLWWNKKYIYNRTRGKAENNYEHRVFVKDSCVFQKSSR